MSYETVTTKERLAWWSDKLSQVAVFAIDTETTSKDPMDCELVGVSLALDLGGKRHACYIPVGHTDIEGNPRPENMEVDDVLEAIAPACLDEDIRKVLHNAVYDVVVLMRYGLELVNVEDTMLMSFVLTVTKGRAGHDMDGLAERYLNYRTISFDEVVRPMLGMQTFAHVPLDNATEYSAEDTDVTLNLYWHFMQHHDAELDVYFTIDQPMIIPIAKMKMNGVAVSTKKMAALSATWQAIVDENTEAFAEVAPGVNLASTASLGKYIYETLGMPVLKTTESGNPSVDNETLELMEDVHPALKFVAAAKKHAKLVSTYTDAIPKLINSSTGRLHTHLAMTSTDTSRLSSSNPNLQNIPSPDNEKNAERGRLIREAFIAPKGKLIVSADYSQIELRMLAQITGDPTLVKAFLDGKDIHAATAEKMHGQRWEVSDAAERKVLRRSAKEINFGIIFGMTQYGLAKKLKCTEDEAQEFIDIYLDAFPEVMKWMERQKLRGGMSREVKTLFGRKLYLPTGNSRAMQSYAERCSLNYPIQGSASDVIRRAIPRVDGALIAAGLDAPMLLQVHDELLFECDEGDVDKVCAVVKHAMETSCDDVIKWKVPILAEAKAGRSWADAH